MCTTQNVITIQHHSRIQAKCFLIEIFDSSRWNKTKNQTQIHVQSFLIFWFCSHTEIILNTCRLSYFICVTKIIEHFHLNATCSLKCISCKNLFWHWNCAQNIINRVINEKKQNILFNIGSFRVIDVTELLPAKVCEVHALKPLILPLTRMHRLMAINAVHLYDATSHSANKNENDRSFYSPQFNWINPNNSHPVQSYLIQIKKKYSKMYWIINSI